MALGKAIHHSRMSTPAWSAHVIGPYQPPVAVLHSEVQAAGTTGLPESEVEMNTRGGIGIIGVIIIVLVILWLVGVIKL